MARKKSKGAGKSKNKNENPVDFITSLSPNTKHSLALGFLLILPCIVFYGPTLGGEQYFSHDTLQWRAGSETIIEHRQNTGEEPLWAHNMFSGMPSYFVSYAKSVPHFDTVISFFDVINPLLPYWVLLTGLYLFFLLLKIRPFAAVLGAVFIAFTAYVPIIVGAGHNTKFEAFTFIPWMFVGYLMITRTDRKLLSFFVFTTATLLELRANHPQITYYFLYLMAIWWLADGYYRYKNNETKQWGIHTSLLAGGGLLALVSNLQPLWSRIEYSSFSIRGGSSLAENATSTGLDLEYAFAWSQGWTELLTLIIPNIMGGASPDYWGPKSVTSGPHYLGAIAFLLLIYALFFSKRREKIVFLISGILASLFSLGSNFTLLNNLMFQYAPFFGKFRAPETWLILAAFSFSVLAVFGFEAICKHLPQISKKQKNMAYYPIIIALMIGAAFTFSSSTFLDFEKPGERQQIARYLAQQNNVNVENRQVQQRASQYISQQMKPKRKALAEDDAFRFTLLVLLAGLVIVGFYHHRISSGTAIVLLVLLASFDMLQVADRYNNDDSLRSDSIDRERLIQQEARPLDRFIFERVQNETAYPYRVYPVLANPFNNAIVSYFYPSVGGYSGAKLSIYQDLIERQLSQINPQVLDMLNVKYLTSRRARALPGTEVVYQGDDGIVLENNDVLPKAFFADSLIYTDTPQSAMAALNVERGFNARKTAILEQPIPYQPKTDTTAAVEVTNYGPRDISLQYSRQSDGFLVLSEIYYPAGWRAFIDGEETPIYKTNYVLRGLFVPEGEHTVEFRFNPASHIWGTRVAWGGNIIVWLIGLAAVLKWYRRRSKTEITTTSNDQDK